MTPITKTIRRVMVETYGYGKRARKLVAAFERRDWPRGGNVPRPSGCSTDNETITRFIHLQPAAGIFSGEQVLGQRIADLLFNGVAHRARAELWMKSLSHKERQNGFVQFQCVTARSQKFNFPRQKLFGNLQLCLLYTSPSPRD